MLLQRQATRVLGAVDIPHAMNVPQRRKKSKYLKLFWPDTRDRSTLSS